jgi:hypothetical protein
MASAFGGLNTQTGAVLGGVSNLASAFMAGGPLALGLVTIGTGISWLTTKYQESTKAAQEAEKAQKEAALKTAKVIEGLTKSIEDQIASTAGYNQAEQAFGKLNKQYEEAEARLDSLKKTTKEQFSFDALRSGQVGDLAEGEKLYAQRLAETYDVLDSLGVERANAIGALEEYNKRTKELAATQRVFAKDDEKAIERLTTKAKATKEVAKATEEATEEIIIEDDRLEQSLRSLGFTEQEIFDQLSGAYLERQKLAEADRKAREDAEKAKTEAVRKAAEERNRIQEQELVAAVNMGLQLTGMVIGHGQQLLDDLITGQEKALERFAVNVMREAGTFMVGKGLELGALATFNLLSGVPTQVAMAPAQFAGAAALVGGGIALGAAATGIEHTMINGGSIGQAAQAGGAGDRATSTPMGAGRISTGGTGDRDRGGMEQVTYVFNAPVFGDQNRSARHVAALQRRGQRNLLLT